MFIPYYQNAGQNHNINICNEAFETVAKFRYLRMIVTKKIYIYKEINSR
jgi:hypothetical protein